MFPKFLRVTPEYPLPINDSNIIYQSSVMQLLNVLADALGFSYEVVFPPDGDEPGKLLPNGTWTGAYGVLQRGEADLVFGGSDMTEETGEYFRLGFPHYISEITFMTKKLKHDPNTAVFLHPFSIPVWLSIIACVCLVPFIFYYLIRRKHSLINLFTSTVGSLVGQGMGQIPRRPREYFVLGTWIIGSSLLCYFYSAVLLSFLTFPSLHGIRTIEDLANGIKDGKYECSMPSFTTFDDYFAAINNPSLQVIANHLRDNKGRVTDEVLEFLEAPDAGKKRAYIGVRENFLSVKEFYFISKENFLTAANVFLMRKDFCCGSEVDEVIHRSWASGLFQRIENLLTYEDFLYVSQQYGQYWLIPPSETQLTMTMLKGPFIFLIVSHSLAFLVFLIELCIGKFKNSSF